ncbi:MAG: glycosyltransferase family 4 protein, partial [bacterium]
PLIWRSIPEVELHAFSYQPLDRYRSLQTDANRRVIFRGGLRQPELARDLALFDLWLYPTDFPETSCIAAMEAQAAGVPVVTSGRYALRETVQDGVTGVLIDGTVGSPAYIARFAETVVSLLRDRARRARMGAVARERMLTQFTWDRVAAQWSELLTRLAGER